MAVHYDLCPDLNIRLFICQGVVTGKQIFEAAKLSDLDSRRKQGMITIMDFSLGDLDVSLDEMKYANNFMKKRANEGFEIEQQLIISPNKTLHIATNGMLTLFGETNLKIKAFYSLYDAVFSSDLFLEPEKVFEFCNQSRNSLNLD